MHRRKLDALDAYLQGGFEVVEITSETGRISVVLENSERWRITVVFDRRDAEAMLYGIEGAEERARATAKPAVRRARPNLGA